MLCFPFASFILDLKELDLALLFQQVDNLLEGEAKDRVKAFIKFTLDEE